MQRIFTAATRAAIRSTRSTKEGHMNALRNLLKKMAAAVRGSVASLHLSRKVVTQGATAALFYAATLLAHRLGWHLPVGYVTYAVPVVAGLVAGYLVPESQNAPVPAAAPKAPAPAA